MNGETLSFLFSGFHHIKHFHIRQTSDSETENGLLPVVTVQEEALSFFKFMFYLLLVISFPIKSGFNRFRCSHA